MLQERRRFARLYVGVEAAYCRTSDPAVKATVLVQDLSVAGLRFIGKEILPVDTRLAMEISLPERTGVLSLEAHVIWQNQFSKSFYDTGVLFGSLTPPTQRLLEQCLQQQVGRAEEQRRFVRCNLSTMVTYESLSATTGAHNCLSMDVSLSGMRALMRELLPEGTALRFSFNLPDDSNPIAALGVVVWARKGEHELFETGIEFSEIDDEELDRINNYIKRSLKIGW